MKILIATGIYPPDIGGPAQYSKNLETIFKKDGHTVAVKFFSFERRLPTGIRHAYFFFRILSAVFKTDVIFAFDTFSVALPTLLAARLLGKKCIVRTGGDFLWESFVERTGDLVLFRNFYTESVGKFSRKEKFLFSLTKFVLQKSNAVIFSTEWQKDIFQKAYQLHSAKLFVVENFYGPKEISHTPTDKNFIAGTRLLKWKNNTRLLEAFSKAKTHDDSISLDVRNATFEVFMDKISKAYAVILVSLGDISPNSILDSIRFNKPFILTRETGLHERITNCAIFVDPENIQEIAEKILWLSNPENYEAQKKKVEAFNFVHTWEDISREFLEISKKV
ncbi:MAG: glycosyltransferase family 4 protein [Patescibacteria group bacterium]